MPKYNLSYYFDGNGEVEIEAKSKKEAEQKWRDGNFDDKTEDEWGQEYCVDEITEV